MNNYMRTNRKLGRAEDGSQMLPKADEGRLLTPNEQTKALMKIPFADLRGQETRDVLCAAQDAKTASHLVELAENQELPEVAEDCPFERLDEQAKMVEDGFKRVK